MKLTPCRAALTHSVRPSLNYYGASVTAVVGTWATLALNISDFTRYAKSTRVEVVGQLLGLPVAV